MEVDDDATSVTCKKVFSHSAEVWSIDSCPWDANVFATGNSDADAGTHSATLWSMASASDAEDEADGGSMLQLDELVVLRGHKSHVRCVLWDPHAGDAASAKLLSMCEESARLWDVSSAMGAAGSAAASLSPLGRVDAPAGATLGAAAWDPHFGHELVLAQDSCLLWHDIRSSMRSDASGKAIRSVDTSAWWNSAADGSGAPPPVYVHPLRCASCAPCHLFFRRACIQQPAARITTVSYNSNKPRQVLSGTTDGVVRIWDTRKLQSGPLKELQAADHSVTACAFNPYHDQLVLSAGTDGVVALWRASSTSSVPLMDDELAGEEDEQAPTKPRKAIADSAVHVRRSHEDSVTSIAWSACTAWLHGSVSYPGKIVFDLVPQAEKLKILMV